MTLCEWLDPAQLFAFGLGLDIAGAFLLARGLLASNAEIARRTSSYYDFNPYATLSEVENREDARFGVASLIAGFTMQVLAYVVTLSTETGEAADVRKVAVAVGATGVGVLVPLVLIRRFRPRWVNRALIDIARIDSAMTNRLPYPHIDRLRGFARALGESAQPGDRDDIDVAKRVFGVEEVMYGRGQSLRTGTQARAESRPLDASAEVLDDRPRPS